MVSCELSRVCWTGAAKYTRHTQAESLSVHLVAEEVGRSWMPKSSVLSVEVCRWIGGWVGGWVGVVIVV